MLWVFLLLVNGREIGDAGNGVEGAEPPERSCLLRDA
jgi:hypothetical protein